MSTHDNIIQANDGKILGYAQTFFSGGLQGTNRHPVVRRKDSRRAMGGCKQLSSRYVTTFNC